MAITIRYFASLREQLGVEQLTIEADHIKTVSDVWDQANPDTPLPDHVLIAVNLNYAQAQATVRDGDEVAFFPPVTGG
ncbi:MAG: molybdopterin converting factor subunit 1 [Gammaproteobacteria bacterium]|nr:molybdopterin converting factor subunit 1 [Gammaproteobacteria bacterium]